MKDKGINRRQFIKYGTTGLMTLWVGSKLPPWVMKNKAFAAVPTQSLDFHITDALKEMHTHNAINDARCYFWIYKSAAPDLPPESPGPTIMANKGDEIQISVTNDLDEDHAFFIPGMVESGPIAPGETWTKSFVASQSGAFLYYDNLNEPVNRVMGLHGAIIVLPTEAQRAPGHRLTPYDNPTPNVQAIFDAFGDPDIYPGLAWEEGDSRTNVPPFRHYLWKFHEASPRLFEEVGNLPEGEIYDRQLFMDKFLRDTFKVNNNENVSNEISYKPQYFTINGQSGFFAHLSSYITPMGRVGEPVVIYILNAGLWLHSLHLHANHFYITNYNGVQENPIWVDVFNIHPMDRIDYVLPFMRPPDVGTVRGIGRAETPLTTINHHPVWPPREEMDMFIPDTGEEKVFRLAGYDSSGEPIRGEEIDLRQRLSPLCYPGHDHAEPSQTTQGGNYNTGLISGVYFVGDRNTPGHMDFPLEEDFAFMFQYRGCELSGTHPCAPELHED